MANQSTELYNVEVATEYECELCHLKFGYDSHAWLIHLRWYRGRRCDLYGPNPINLYNPERGGFGQTDADGASAVAINS